jgi:hypothetical protein
VHALQLPLEPLGGEPASFGGLDERQGEIVAILFHELSRR